MAQRRMFSKKIIDTDAFMDMPTSSQLLYFHLAMNADDDGFVASPKKIMKSIGCQDDAAKILLAKRYILGFESGVIVIKHWKIHNYIQNDRKTKTTYQKEIESLGINDFGAYTEKEKCIQNVSKMDTQVRLGKDSIGKVNTIVHDFEEVWKSYPKPIGKKEAQRHFNASVNNDKDFNDLKIAIKNYKESKSVKNGYIQNGSTFFNNWQDWIVMPETEKFCEICKGTGKFTSKTGYECVCKCPAGNNK